MTVEPARRTSRQDGGNLKPPVYVDTNQGLQKLVRTLAQQPAIAVDTESNPLFAYRERLCLIQVSTKHRDYIIDPLAGIDLDLLVPVFADPGLLKIFHDAEFDVLMMKRAHAFEIAGIFDTKVAVTSLGYATVGLAPLLKELYGVILDKRFQRSDWGHRPISEGQLDYARLDTHFLISLADRLREELRNKDEIHGLEVATECRRLEGLIPETREFNPDEFSKIKSSDDLSGKQRRVLRELFVMRHQIADEQDRPAFKVFSNDVLMKLAHLQPTSEESLKKQKILSPRVREQRGAVVLATIRRAQKMSPVDRVALRRHQNEANRLTDEQRQTYETLRAWRKKVASQRNTDASLVLLRSTMVELSRLRSRPRDRAALRASGLLEPWRAKFYGEGILRALTQPTRGGQERQRRRRQERKP